MGDLISPAAFDPQAFAAMRAEEAINERIPARFQRKIDLPPQVAEWANSRTTEGLYLVGPVGAGKTHTAYQAAAQWFRTRGGEPFLTVHRYTSFLDRLRPRDNGSHYLTISEAQMATLLFLDDIGAEKPSEWTQERLYEVVDERYVHERPILITSNIPPKQLAEQVGERVASRLAESCRVVALTGGDRRKQS